MMIITPENFFTLLKRYLPENPIILEAGAFNGKDTKRLSAAWPKSIIHAFEPVPEIFAELIAQTKAYDHIHTYPLALSNKTGSTLFYIAQHPKRPGKICQAGSVLKPKDRLSKSPITYPATITVPTITLNDWATKNTIPKIDFMWLDLQGHELAVLEAATTILNATTLIYLEVNFIEAYENQGSCHAINDWLLNQGFIPIARDFDDNPHWFFGNILYLNKNNPN